MVAPYLVINSGRYHERPLLPGRFTIQSIPGASKISWVPLTDQLAPIENQFLILTLIANRGKKKYILSS